MSPPETHEQALLRDAGRVLASAEASCGPAARLAVLEAAASLLAGWSFERYQQSFPDSATPVPGVTSFAEELVSQLHQVSVPAPLAIAALGHGVPSRHQQRTEGAFYTDFRLASFVGEQVADDLPRGARIIDLAAGSGMLLVASVLAAARGDRRRATDLVAESVCAADLDGAALRACRASLAALCADLAAVHELDSRLRRRDSLIAGKPGWADIAPQGFDVVVGNPPWGKLKVSRHEFMRANGHDRHYGDDYALDLIDHQALGDERARRAAYAMAVVQRYPVSGSGELDFYKAFAACSLEMLRDGGTCCLLLPAGLIRSQGTQPLRLKLFETCGSMNFTVTENRAKFFSIDTRFKFIVLTARKASTSQPVELSLARGLPDGVQVLHTARFARGTLKEIRPDLTIPEVRGKSEWDLAVAMHQRGTALDAAGSPFRASIVREVDMTRDRTQFSAAAGEGYLPLIEGRMIAQHRFAAKAYVTGTGRRALWRPMPFGDRKTQPQFYFPAGKLPPAVRQRIQEPRVGFCDVTGQTNERSIIAARIPAQVICGNKVPTITFANDGNEDRSWLFLAISNSLPLDWISRRVLTTSVNYFLLRSLPFPPITIGTRVADRLVELAKKLSSIDTRRGRLSDQDLWQWSEWRAEIDAQVLVSWGLGAADLRLMLDDFPLLDRGQPALPGERSATITRDLALCWAARLTGGQNDATDRIRTARALAALAYVPSEYAKAVRSPGS
jgi:methylase of polypeptide subunit release factors